MTTFTFHGRPRDALRRVETALRDEGFEVTQRLDLSRLLKDRLGADLLPAHLLYVVHPVVLFQALLADGDPTLFFPILILVRSSGGACCICFCSALGGKEDAPSVLSGFLAEQAQLRVRQASQRVRAALTCGKDG